MTMIKAEYNRAQRCFTVNGHAGFDKKGRDIVCAAVSALVLTLAAAVQNIRRDGYCVRLDGGSALISAKGGGDDDKALSLVFETIASGLLLCAEEYPEYVEFDVT